MSINEDTSRIFCQTEIIINEALNYLPVDLWKLINKYIGLIDCVEYYYNLYKKNIFKLMSTFSTRKYPFIISINNNIVNTNSHLSELLIKYKISNFSHEIIISDEKNAIFYLTHNYSLLSSISLSKYENILFYGPVKRMSACRIPIDIKLKSVDFTNLHNLTNINGILFYEHKKLQLYNVSDVKKITLDLISTTDFKNRLNNSTGLQFIPFPRPLLNQFTIKESVIPDNITIEFIN